MTATGQGLQLKTKTTLRVYDGDIESYRIRYGRAEGERRFYAERAPQEERVIEGNLALQEGIVALFNLLCGETETAFSEANAYLAVGDSNTAAADTQTGLQAVTNKLYQAMDTGYPVVGAAADKKVTFRATFGSDDANFAWEEWSVANGDSDSADNLNRKVASLGTKSAGSSWQLTVEISAA
jgi:hypothetical protein